MSKINQFTSVWDAIEDDPIRQENLKLRSTLMMEITERIKAQELTQAQAEQDALQEQLEFVASDDYLEQWARVEARMTLPGQVVIIPLQQTEPGEPAQTGSFFPAAPPAPSIPEQWRRLFFGDDAAP